MNDKIIISTISKIHFTILSFIVFIFLSLFVVFITLQNGITIDKISIPSLQVKKLYIKWDEKINLSIDTLKFTSKTTNDFHINHKQISKIIKNVFLFQYFFKNISISNIVLNKTSASLKLTDNGDGFFNLSSEKFFLKSLLTVRSNILKLKILDFKYFKNKITADGTILLDLKKVNLTALINLNINNIANFKAKLHANKNRLFYKINTPSEIKDTNYLINIFNLPKEVKYWVIDAINMSSLKLNSAFGWLDYKKTDQAYKNFYANATINKLAYSYNQKLDAIHTKITELEFHNGILNIRPKEAYSYGFFLDKSWLKIDFNKKEELLTLFLKFKGSLNTDMLNILNTYHINLPFSQNSGEVNTNLKLDVNLMTLDVKAIGDFFTKESNFNYLGLDLDIFDAYISLNNYDVKIKDMSAKYKDIAAAKVNVSLNTKTHKGNINFKVEKVDLKDINLSLKKQKKQLIVNYKISPKKDMIYIEKSKWLMENTEVDIDSLSIPFDLNKLIADIPTTLIQIPNMATAYVSGKALLKQASVNLKIDLLKFSHNNIELLQSNTQLNFLYKNKQAKLKLLDKVRLRVNNTNTIVENLLIDLRENILSIADVSLNVENIFNTNLYGYYNLQSKNGMLNLSNLDLKFSGFNDIFSKKDTLKLFIKSTDKNTTIYSETFDTKYTLTDNDSKLKFNSLFKLSRNSQLLRDYNLTNGDVTFYNNDNNNIYFSANIKYPHKLLVVKNKELENYTIRGQLNYKDNKAHIIINNLVKIDIDDKVLIKAENVGLNLNSMLKIINSRNSDSKTFKKSIILNSKNCYLYIDKNRHIISDTIDLQYLNNSITAQLVHNKAKAGFKLENNIFHLYGEKFNDKFMENLFAFSKFKGGSFAFTMSGSTKEYDGTFVVKNTTIRSYKILNNVLAFVNTIPSLVTFSLPGYNINGLPVKEAYMNFKTKHDTYNISDIYLESSELKILGQGVANIKKNKINLDLNLKTDLGVNASKIPIVGYILFNEDSMSTSVSVTGALDNPDVTSHVARDIIIAPLNIIKRTFELPFKLFEKD